MKPLGQRFRRRYSGVMMGTRVGPGLRVAWLIVVMMLFIPSVAAGFGGANPVLADSEDAVRIARISPPPIPGIAAGRTERFVAEVSYNLTSVEQAILVLFVFENTDPNAARARSDHLVVSKGQGQATLTVEYGAPWHGVSSVAVAAVLFKDEKTALTWTNTEAIPVNPSKDRVLFDEAVVAQRAGQYQQAIEKLTAAIETAPKVANYYHWRGDNHAYLKQYGAAVADYSRALELAPGYRPSLVNRGIAKMWMTQFRSAAEDFDWAIGSGATDGWTAWAHRGRGICQALLGARAKAVADFEDYLRLWPQAQDQTSVREWIVALSR